MEGDQKINFLWHLLLMGVPLKYVLGTPDLVDKLSSLLILPVQPLDLFNGIYNLNFKLNLSIELKDLRRR